MNLKIFTDNIEEKAFTQVHNLLAQPAFANCKVRIMPDVHAGTGCVIGFTADLGDKVIPNVVGVDIGCGMITCDIGVVDIDYTKLDTVIREKIPAGMNVHAQAPVVYDELENVLCLEHLKNLSWLQNSLGTLGGGNHFIEVDVGEDGHKYLVVHTGSRNLGKQVADYYQSVAIERINGGKADLNAKVQQLINDYKTSGREKEIAGAIKELRLSYASVEKMPNELCYLNGEDRLNYLHDMGICQRFAVKNRAMIVETICDAMGWNGVSFETIHNYIDLESNIIRKGAISAQKGQRVLIPINMRDGCIIGIGKGNEDWNCSAPHGAGRVMSRMQAKKTVSMDDYKKSMNGIFTTSVSEDTLDECPMAYKPMDEILKNIEPTVEVEKIIRPVYNFKVSE